MLICDDVIGDVDLASVLTADQLTGNGKIAALESKLKAHYGKKYALCVCNATIGLWAIALALDLKNTEFITSPYSYGATLAGWLLQGNTPQFAAVNPLTLCLDPEAVRSQITPQTRAILSVDLFGTPAPMAELRAIADEYGLWLISDAAQSFGAFDRGQPASQGAEALVISFTVGKTLNCGEGGAILTDNAELYEKLLWWTQHPYRQKRDLGLNLTNEFALNGRIHPLAAAIACEQFEIALKHCQQKQLEILDILTELTCGELILPLPFTEDGILPSFFRCCLPLSASTKQGQMIDCLQEGYPKYRLESFDLSPLYQHPAFLAQHGDRLLGTEFSDSIDPVQYAFLTA